MIFEIYKSTTGGQLPVLLLALVNAAKIDAPFGEPRPVQASQPGPAEYDPLFPCVMSWKALAF